MKMKPSLFRSVFVKCLAISALVLGLHSQKAEAKIINLYLDLYPGLTLSPSAFSLPTEENYNGDDLYHSQTSANSLGFHLGGRAGLDALIFTAQLRFDQYLDVTDGSRFSGTLGQLVGGFHFAVIDNESLRFHLNILGGLVFGLGLNPQYPIDRDQISKFGFTGELEFRLPNECLASSPAWWLVTMSLDLIQFEPPPWTSYKTTPMDFMCLPGLVSDSIFLDFNLFGDRFLFLPTQLA